MDKMRFYEKTEDSKVRCTLCPFFCVLKDGETGRCRVRVNEHGEIKSLIYNKIVSLALDPIEKKPLYHFMPGSQILSIGTAGCNFRCQFCQNWELSQSTNLPLKEITPEFLLQTAQKYQSIGIAYTYSEPVVWFETVLETAEVFHKAGLKNVMVTNGFINKEPLEVLTPLIDAVNIDVKSFDQKFYSRYVGGRLDVVKENVEYLYDKMHIELTMLIIPGLNDNMTDIEKFVQWVSRLDKNIPVHFSRYFPNYQMQVPFTPAETLYKIKRLAEAYLTYVHLGNI